MRQSIYDMLRQITDSTAAWQWSLWLSIALLALFAWLAYELWSRIVIPIVALATRRTHTKWDDVLLSRQVLRAMGQLLPALIVDYYLPLMFKAEETTMTYIWVSKLTNIYIVWAVWFLVMRLVKALYNRLVESGKVEVHSTKGLLQMGLIIVSCVAVIIAVSILIGKSPAVILTALGASTAVLMLVFQDSIKGLVAGFMLSGNKMLKKGDWIVVDRAGANGEVEDVSLVTVKVRNWDESITSLPTYVLISESFHNYANMREGGGRRVARSVFIDINSVRYLSDAEVDLLREDGFVPDEPSHRSDYNAAVGDSAKTIVKTADGADSINLRLFRRWLEAMLLANPNVRTDMRMMVRQLQPTPQGLPLELFFFVKQTEWTAFEVVQSDIFDTVYAAANRFGLRLFQAPAGTDLTPLR